MDFFNFALCHVCKNPSPDLKKCGKCKVLHYCSVQHQKQDWPVHRNICKMITQLENNFPFKDGMSAHEINLVKSSRGAYWSFQKSGKLTKCENNIWMHPKICRMCFSSNVNVICQDCLNVAYCSKDHQQSHKVIHEKFCHQLKLSLDIDLALFSLHVQTGWVTFNFQRNTTTLPEDISEVMKAIEFKGINIDYSENSIDLAMLSDPCSFGINAIYALETSNFVKERCGKKPKLVLHMVGPHEGFTDNSCIFFIEMISHWIFNLKFVDIFLIGCNNENSRLSYMFKQCEHCSKKQFSVVVTKIQGEYYKVFNKLPRPDLVLLLNCDAMFGLEAPGQNVPKLSYCGGIPMLLTTCSEQALSENLDTIPFDDIKFLIEPQKNVYASLRPRKNHREGVAPIFYFNGWITIFAKK